MVGWITWSETLGGWRPHMEETQAAGFPLLRADLPVHRNPSAQVRRVLRGARRLVKAGCRRVLTEPGFCHWTVLADWGLRPVEAGRLSQALAAPLILAALAQQGIPASRACVALRGDRVTPACARTAETLCHHVRQLIIDIPADGTELARYLRAEYGVAVLEEGTSNAGACFSPKTGVQDGLQLYGVTPVLPGLAILPPGPDYGIDPLPLAALLWEEGRLKLEDIRIVTV
ncbi:MAG: hypothetical protein HFE97_09825 [Oscillospiraceae bacterium]|nr:hypothetical protein [Oscillospiraceae bacterium]